MLLVPREALVVEVVIGDRFGHSNRAMIAFKISGVLSALVLLPRWTRRRRAQLENQHVLLMGPW